MSTVGVMVSQISGVSIVYSKVCSRADQINHQSSASLAFGRGIHRRRVNPPHKGPVTRNMFPFDDIIIIHASGFKLHLFSYQSQRPLVVNLTIFSMAVLMSNEYTLILNFPYILIYSNYSTRALLTQTVPDTDNEPIIQGDAFCVLSWSTTGH